jgi:hypothetical protein
MKEVKQIAQALLKGDVKEASLLRKKLVIKDEVVEYEVVEVVRQAMIMYLKEGKIEKAQEIKKHFSIPESVLDETVKQAVLSSFRSGDTKRVIEMRDKLPITEVIGKQLVDYCSTWGKQDFTSSMKNIFSVGA